MSGISPQCTSRIESYASGGDDPDVGAERDLGAAADAVAVDGGDHRRRQELPAVGDALGEVGVLAVAAGEHVLDRAAARGEAHQVEAGAEALAGAVQDDRTDRGVGGDLVDRGVDGLEHREVERVVLVGPVEADLGDVVGDRRPDPVLDRRSSPDSGPRPRGGR